MGVNTIFLKISRFIIIIIMMIILVRHHAQAAAMIGTQVWEVHDILSTVNVNPKKYAAVYGDILVQDYGAVVMHDQLDATKFIEIDVKALTPANRQRLHTECVHGTCSEIITGFIRHGKIVAVHEYHF